MYIFVCVCVYIYIYIYIYIYTHTFSSRKIWRNQLLFMKWTLAMGFCYLSMTLTPVSFTYVAR